MTRLSLLAAVVLTVVAGGLRAWDVPHGLAVRQGADWTVRSGFVFLKSAGDGALQVEVPGPFRLAVDGQFVLERAPGDSVTVATVPLALNRSPHVLEIAHEPDVTPRLSWTDASAHVAFPVPESALAPVALGPISWRLREARPFVGLAAAFAWTSFMLWVAWRWFERRLPGTGPSWDRPMVTVVAAAGVLAGAGIWWAWPTVPWAPDELWPSTVMEGVSRHFTGGWFDLYPPGHFYILAVAYVPTLVLHAVDLLPIDRDGLDAALQLISRGVSWSMALGILVLVARLAEHLGGRAQAWPAAVCATASLPFVFYARLANVDVPYLFWFCASLLFLRAAAEKSRRRDIVGFAVTAMLAVVTKDQAYGLYVLPAVWISWRVVRHPGGAGSLAIAALLAGLTFAAGHNLPLNVAGFREHVASITGGGSETYRMVAPSLAGLASLAGIVAGQLWWALGVPGVVLVGLGLWQSRTSTWIPGWVWLFPMSYLLTFVAVVGYSYDRFLLPVTLVCGLAGGAGLRTLLTAGETSRRARWVAWTCVAWLVWRVASVDALVLRDSRYEAESWLAASVPRGALVASVWQAGYQPRLEAFRHQEIAPTVEGTLGAAPDFIVVNREFVRRYPDGAPMPTWLGWLESTESPYVEAWRWKDPLRGTELAWWPTFTDRLESPFTNLDKVNPEIVVFRRK